MSTSHHTQRDALPDSLAVIATGGTISSIHTDSHSTAPVLDPKTLFSTARLAQPHRIQSLMAKDSATMSLRDMQDVCDAISEQLRDPSTSGVIVLHGTDAMEETSYLAHLQIQDHRPVIFTGAQFPADAPNADGPCNLRFATAAASTWPSAHNGDKAPNNSVYVAFNNRLYCPPRNL